MTPPPRAKPRAATPADANNYLQKVEGVLQGGERVGNTVFIAPVTQFTRRVSEPASRTHVVYVLTIDGAGQADAVDAVDGAPHLRFRKSRRRTRRTRAFDLRRWRHGRLASCPGRSLPNLGAGPLRERSRRPNAAPR